MAIHAIDSRKFAPEWVPDLVIISLILMTGCLAPVGSMANDHYSNRPNAFPTIMYKLKRTASVDECDDLATAADDGRKKKISDAVDACFALSQPDRGKCYAELNVEALEADSSDRFEQEYGYCSKKFYNDSAAGNPLPPSATNPRGPAVVVGLTAGSSPTKGPAVIVGLRTGNDAKPQAVIVGLPAVKPSPVIVGLPGGVSPAKGPVVIVGLPADNDKSPPVVADPPRQ